jgi:hypothetical protein
MGLRTARVVEHTITGIKNLAFRRTKIYTHLGGGQHNSFSWRSHPRSMTSPSSMNIRRRSSRNPFFQIPSGPRLLGSTTFPYMLLFFRFNKM